MSAETPTQCAHPACRCLAEKDSKYCSQVCKESANMTEIACQCGHTACPAAINPSR
jgi:hypothetical protein